LAKKPSGRRRADVKINALEQFELRSRSSVLEKQAAKSARALAKEAKSAERIARMLEVEKSVQTGKTVSFTSRVVSGISRETFRRNVVSATTFSISAALIATFALPANAFSPEVTALAGLGYTDFDSGINRETQGLTVGQAKQQTVVSRGGAKTVGASTLRAATLNNYRAWSGFSAEDYLKNPSYDAVVGAQVVKVAAKYVGVPYVFGGSTPAGFDCSGYVRYVYSQFGVPLAHSVRAQAARGKLIRAKDAQPGDLVIWNDGSHNGIYAGGGNVLHAPQRGDSVKLAKIWTDAVHYVRIYK
jgi:cell wall-associated NlpC family hydrolase